MSAAPAVTDRPIEHYVGWANRTWRRDERWRDQNTTFHQIVNISQGLILRAFGELGPFGRSQLAFKIVEQPVDDRPLSFIERLLGMSIPEMGLQEDPGQDVFRTFNGAIKTA